MNKKEISHLFIVTLFILPVIICSCNNRKGKPLKEEKQTEIIPAASAEKPYKVTFIELGSVKCVPCQQMQTVMKSIEAKFGKEVKINFHDVWTETGKLYGVKYGINEIPTQIFLDESGKEYYRHVGFFPEEELVKILEMKGVKVN